MTAHHRPIKSILLTLWLVLALLAVVQPAAGQADTQPVSYVLEAEGPLTPAMLSYIERGIRRAETDDAALLVLQLDTPGGDINLMNEIIQRIRASEVPVVVYVAPNGAIAGSAGTLITLAGHAAAMAPETAIGAASPVGSQGEDIGTTMESKVKEIMKASARSLADRRGEEAVRLAEETIENARAVSAREALDAGLVDFIATNRVDLLRQLDGYQVELDGEEITLATTGLQERSLGLTMVEQALQLLTNPNIVFLLLAVGVQAILIELSSPGGWVSGFIGVVALLLSVYGLGILPVNWFGILFIILAFVLFIVDIKAPTHGALTTAGAGSFIAGALILFNSTPLPGFPRVSVPLVIGVGMLSAVTFFAAVRFAMRAMRMPVSMGQETLVGRSGIVRQPLSPQGTVQVAGELWTAEAEDGQALPYGAPVTVVSVDGLRVIVRPLPPR